MPIRSASKTQLVAIGWAILSSACLAVLWVIVRHLSVRYHAFEITFFGTLFGLLVFIPWMIKVGPTAFRSQKKLWHLVRATCNGIGILAWFWALTLMPLADAAALNLIAPLAVTIAAMIFLGEIVRLRRWIALGFGAAGALVVIRPGFQEISLGVWLVLITVLFSAFQRIIAKQLTRTEGSATSVVYLLVFMLPITFLAALTEWVTPLPADFIGFAAIGLLLGSAHYCLMASLQLADVSALEPFNFTRLIWGALFGFFIFNEEPKITTVIGGVMIIVATSYLAHREAALRRSEEPEKTLPPIT